MSEKPTEMREVIDDEQRDIAGGAAYSPDPWVNWSKLFAGSVTGGSAGNDGGLLHEATHAK